MTFREYENLQVGDKVILPFSSEKEQIVINANSDMVITKPIGSAHNPIIYTNGYQTIGLYNTIYEEKLETEAWNYIDSTFDQKGTFNSHHLLLAYKAGYSRAKEE